MGRLGVELLLIALTVFVAIGFLVTYIVAVKEDHVMPDLPYISDTGSKAPESCVFSLICNLAAMLLFVAMFIRFKHINTYHTDTIRGMWCLNLLSLCCGALSVFGLMLVGCFQNDAVPVVHYIGALTVFGLGVVYEWLQSYISFKIYHANLTRHVGSVTICLRILLSVLNTLFFASTIVTGVLANMYYVPSGDGDDKFWLVQDEGFALHVASAASEWATSGTFLLYFLTFHPDFKRIRVDMNVRLKYQLTDSIINESTPLTI